MLRSALDFLGGPGPVALAIALLFATPVIDRLFVRRKRVGFRVLYNSKIGLGPEQLHDGTDAHAPQLRELVRVLDRMSIVVIRVRNSGNYDIDPDDFDRPLTFTFGDRIVWNARVSEAGSEELREEVRRSLQFFGRDTGQARVSLPTVRERMALSVGRLFRPGPDRAPAVAEPVWHGVRLDGLTLRRKQKFKLLVVLREPEANRNGELGKDVRVAGSLGNTGVLHDEKQERLLTLPRLTGGLAAVLAGVLVLTLAWTPGSQDPTVACGEGELRVEGSSVFMPTMQKIAEQYQKACPQARVTTEANGSIEGFRNVEHADPGAPLIALSDGEQNGLDVVAHQAAIVVYHVITHPSVGVDSLRPDQLRDIYAGRYTDWSQLRGGDPLPIRIVSRDGDSGTRKLFEGKVLDTREGALTSDDCRTARLNPQASVIRCERKRNDDVVREVAAVDGAIGYADAPSVAEARKAGKLEALAIGGKMIDTTTGIDAGYPFWTVEYLYTKGRPPADSLGHRFIQYVQGHNDARVRMTDAGYLPCPKESGTEVLCTQR
ncbi:substrate-binding domain-containing protein [Saccharothrix sp. SC076]|nr:substrate-binding domain-containing protein [Saccharothrix obliqua]